ncbi:MULTISPECIES: methionyl-tRNA formyltransferase [unclassified Helicobacter]|uniref:methionyl-tRNA formyltransferase n=1 Tax=unclassified Helicobacter TaxID=2593540 RepID=UPI000CF06933|nr:MULTISPECIES: methionyl-tRNA formyltransferase [unclassified Helicobacter]
MKVLFMGTPLFAKIILEQLLLDSQNFQVVGLFCQPDKPFGRKQELKAPDTKEFLSQNYPNIPIFQPSNLKEESLHQIKELNPDVILVVAYGKILPREFLSFRCINIHASILPQYRGASPIQEMLLNNDKLWGVSAMQMEEGLDSGDILGLSIIPSNNNQDLSSLSIELANIGADLVKEVLNNLNRIKPLAQNHAQATYCKKIKKDAGKIEFLNAREIVLKYRAFGTWPSIFLENGLKLFDVTLGDVSKEYKKGEILQIQKDFIEIGCQKGSIRVGSLQAPNKQKVSASAYVIGRRFSVGMILE